MRSCHLLIVQHIYIYIQVGACVCEHEEVASCSCNGGILIHIHIYIYIYVHVQLWQLKGQDMARLVPLLFLRPTCTPTVALTSIGCTAGPTGCTSAGLTGCTSAGLTGCTGLAGTTYPLPHVAWLP